MAPLVDGFDLTRDADLIDRRTVEEAPARQRKVRGDAGALHGAELLDDMHEDLLPLAEEDGEGGLMAPSAAVVAVTTAAALGAFAVARLIVARLAIPRLTVALFMVTWLAFALLPVSLLIIAAFAFTPSALTALPVAAAP